MHKFKSWKNKHRICQESRHPELSFQTCLQHALNLLTTLIFLWIVYRDYELCRTEILKNSDGKLHKKLTIPVTLHGIWFHYSQNTKSWTRLEYIVYMSMCLFIWDVLFSMNLSHTYLDLWQINRSWFIIFDTWSQKPLASYRICSPGYWPCRHGVRWRGGSRFSDTSLYFLSITKGHV